MKFGPNKARMKERASVRRSADKGGSSALTTASVLPTMLQQRILAILLAVVLAVSMVPSNALASDTDEPASSGEVAAQASDADGAADDAASAAGDTAEASKDVDEASGDIDTDISSSTIGETASDNDLTSNGANSFEGTGENAAADSSAASPSSAKSASTAVASSVDSLAVQNDADNQSIDADQKVKTTFEIIGVDEAGKPQTWVLPTTLNLNKGATAADAFLALLDNADLGLKADYDPDTQYGFYLKSITRASENRALGYDETTGKYWQFFVNGVSSDLGLSGVVLDGTQTLTLAYTGWGEKPSYDDQVSASVSIVGPDADGSQYAWASQPALTLKKGQKVSDAIDALIASAGLHASISGTGEDWWLNSINAPYDDSKSLGWDSSTGKFWQVFVNGKAAEYGPGQIELADGDEVSLSYSAQGEAAPGWVLTSVEIIGADANGNPVRWAAPQSLTVREGSTVADLTKEYFENSNLTAWYTDKDDYWNLDAIASPYGNHEFLGTEQDDSGNWNYWALYVNGAFSENAANKRELSNGDKVVWAYSAGGSTQPNPDEFVINPGATRPDYASSWSGFGNGGNTTLVNVPTSGEAAEKKWSVSLKTNSDPYVSIGDPIIANGEVYVTSNTELIKIDADGKVVNRVNKGGKTSYFSRPVYADGLIICASDDGTIAAFTADTLTCVWKTKPLAAPANGGSYQANSTMTVLNGYVYAEFEAGAGASGTASAGAMVCVNIATGEVAWTKTTVKGATDFGAGYYWAGACASGNDLIIGDESGSVKLIDAATGDAKSTVSLFTNDGSLTPCRATIVSAGIEDGKQVYLAVGREPATLFKIARETDTLSIISSVQFGGTSTSTPAVANGKAYIGCNGSNSIGQLAIVDIASMSVDDVVSTNVRGGVQSSPLVSVQGDDTYVYFTVNNNPGGVYRYSVNSRCVDSLFAPEGAEANYCTASVIADKQGNLYYSNDSGTLFALKAMPGYKVVFETGKGSSVGPANPVQGKKMVKPDDPTRDGYTFGGWFTDYECTSAWDFSKPVTSDMTLYAKWTKNPEQASGSNHESNSGQAPKGNGDGNANGGSNNGGNVPSGRALLGAPSPSSTPVLASAAIASDASSADDAAASDADDSAKASSEKASVKSATKKSSSNEAATTSAADDGQSDAGVPIWAYVVLVIGIAGAVGAIAWFVAARRKGNKGM